MEHGTQSIEALLSLLKNRANCEDKYAKLLKAATESGSGAFAWLRGNKGKEVESDQGTFHIALGSTQDQLIANSRKRSEFASLLNQLAAHIETLKSQYNDEVKA